MNPLIKDLLNSDTLDAVSFIMKTDSYKWSQWSQQPENTEYMQYYSTARANNSGLEDLGGIVTSGVRALANMLSEVVITRADVDLARLLTEQHFGFDLMNYGGWMTIATEFEGKLPILMRAYPEGYIVPFGQPTHTFENTDPRFAWLVGPLETAVLRSIWYPQNIATNCVAMRKGIVSRLLQTMFPKLTESDDLDARLDEVNGLADFMLHDFGGRAITGDGTLGPMAHQQVFKGTDTFESIPFIMKTYQLEDVPSFSIPAREHSTTTSWEHEDDAFWNSFEQWAHTTFAVVIDSYDAELAVKRLTNPKGKFVKELRKRGGKCILRPDSGDPTQQVIMCLNAVANNVGYTLNEAGFAVIDPQFGVIQGDGINATSMMDIMDNVIDAGFCVSNIAFGMGGGLLQQVCRDDYANAIKACAKQVGGVFGTIQKNPITDPSKASRAGYLTVGSVAAVTDQETGRNVFKAYTQMDTEHIAFANGYRLVDDTFEEVRARTRAIVSNLIKKEYGVC